MVKYGDSTIYMGRMATLTIEVLLPKDRHIDNIPFLKMSDKGLLYSLLSCIKGRVLFYMQICTLAMTIGLYLTLIKYLSRKDGLKMFITVSYLFIFIKSR